jgi:hypothetical protein
MVASTPFERTEAARGRRALTAAQWVQWSPGGTQLLYARDYGNRGLWRANADGTRRRQIIQPSERPIRNQTSYQTWQPTWAPDGRRVAFGALWEVSVGDGEDTRSVAGVCTVGVDGRKLRVLSEGSNPVWSPDGRWIAFTTDRGAPVRTISTTSQLCVPMEPGCATSSRTPGLADRARLLSRQPHAALHRARLRRQQSRAANARREDPHREHGDSLGDIGRSVVSRRDADRVRARRSNGPPVAGRTRVRSTRRDRTALAIASCSACRSMSETVSGRTRSPGRRAARSESGARVPR